ncbi:MAG: PspC domain-containing protein [Ilumatobacter sp.]|nr:PspC domain-containing protein [Ilumatobacter sp.]
MPRRDTPLYRDTGDQKIAGVCSGLARYFDVDTTLVRVVFVALLIFGGWSLVAYLLLWWLVDPAPTGTWSAPSADDVVPPGAA